MPVPCSTCVDFDGIRKTPKNARSLLRTKKFVSKLLTYGKEELGFEKYRNN